MFAKEQKRQKVMGSVAPMQRNGVAARRIPSILVPE
jgi:hypothetical protein